MEWATGCRGGIAGHGAEQKGTWSSLSQIPPPYLSLFDPHERSEGSIDPSHVVGLRDRALISLMTYTFARVGAVLSMRVEDYYPQGKRWWVISDNSNSPADGSTNHGAMRVPRGVLGLLSESGR